MSRALTFILLLTVLCAVGQAGWHYTRLPERVATHFNLQGEANGWSSRQTHFFLQAGLAAGLGLLFGSMRRILEKVPDSLINIPHRDYWLAPERRARSLDAMGAIMQVCGIVCLGFFVLVFQHVYHANISGRLELRIGPLLIGLFIFITGLVTIMMFRFRKPADPAPARRRRR